MKEKEFKLILASSSKAAYTWKKYYITLCTINSVSKTILLIFHQFVLIFLKNPIPLVMTSQLTISSSITKN